MFIVKMRHLNVGCAINRTFLGCIMYGDDLIVLSASVTGLQSMLECCNQVGNSVLLKFNVLKSSCSVIGPASKLNIVDSGGHIDCAGCAAQKGPPTSMV